jgi:hypothetical protein
MGATSVRDGARQEDREDGWQTKRSIDFQDLDKNGKPAADGDQQGVFDLHVERINGR